MFVKQIAEDFNLEEGQVEESIKTVVFKGTGLSGVLLKKLTEFDFGTLPTKGDLRTFIRGR